MFKLAIKGVKSRIEANLSCFMVRSNGRCGWGVRYVSVVLRVIKRCDVFRNFWL